MAYEKLLFKTIKEGAFDDIFLSEDLDGLKEEERQRILYLSRKYHYLCFYRGDMDYWLESVEGITDSNCDTIVAIILSNYNYLIRLAKNGGENVLNFLSKFKSSELFEKGAIISLLLLNFHDDDTLETILIDMAREDGRYRDFTDTQKIILCDTPEGVLYKETSDGLVILSRDELKKSIVGDENYSIKDIDSKSFSEIVANIYYEYNGCYLLK